MPYNLPINRTMSAMSIHRSRGFTLIELLVVISIIGVLSAVVLASLNTARSKGNDAAIQSDMATIQTEAEIYYGGDGGNTYGAQAWTNGAACATTAIGVFSDSIVQRALAGANSVNGAGDIACFANNSGYLVAVALTSTAGTYWCVDQTGAARKVTATFPTSAPAGNVCP